MKNKYNTVLCYANLCMWALSILSQNKKENFSSFQTFSRNREETFFNNAIDAQKHHDLTYLFH